MQNRIIWLLHNKLTENLVALYGAHFARYLLPLITIPYLARVLGVNTWGILAFIQAYSLYIAILVEFGFGLSATREIARHRDSKEDRGNILAGVIGAQMLLALLGVMITLVIQPFVPLLKNNLLMLWIGVFSALAQGFSLLWYFQGLESMRLVAVLDISAKCFATAGIFLLVHSPGDAWKVFASYLVANLTSVILSLSIIYKNIPFRFPFWSQIRTSIQMSWLMFIMRINGISFSSGNTIILGLAVSPEMVGYFAGAEKIASAVRQLLTPVIQGIYPRISYLVTHSVEKAVRLLKNELLILGIVGAMLSALVLLFSPLLVSLLLGRNFEPAIPVLKILSFLPTIIAFNLVLGSHWLLPMGYDRLFTLIGIRIVIINFLLVILVIVFIPIYALNGAAWAIILSQAFATANLFFVIYRKGSSLALSANRRIKTV